MKRFRSHFPVLNFNDIRENEKFDIRGQNKAGMLAILVEYKFKCIDSLIGIEY